MSSKVHNRLEVHVTFYLLLLPLLFDKSQFFDEFLRYFINSLVPETSVYPVPKYGRKDK